MRCHLPGRRRSRHSVGRLRTQRRCGVRKHPRGTGRLRCRARHRTTQRDAKSLAARSQPMDTVARVSVDRTSDGSTEWTSQAGDFAPTSRRETLEPIAAAPSSSRLASNGEVVALSGGRTREERWTASHRRASTDKWSGQANERREERARQCTHNVMANTRAQQARSKHAVSTRQARRILIRRRAHGSYLVQVVLRKLHTLHLRVRHTAAQDAW